MAVVGPPGSGKTTLLLCAAGILAPDTGVVRSGRAEYVAGHGSAHPYLSVRASMDFTATLYELSVRDDIPEVEATLVRAGLSEVSQVRVGALGAGMRAHAAIAHALLGAPDVLCLDDPLASLDADERRRYGAFLRALGREGIAVLLTARDARQVAGIADRTLALDSGQLVSSATGARSLELDVGTPGAAASALAGRVPSVHRRGRALRVSLDRVSAEEVLSTCRALGIDVHGSRVISDRAAGRVAEGRDSGDGRLRGSGEGGAPAIDAAAAAE